MILLDQKYKPSFDIEFLLKDNKHLIENDVIAYISKLPLLLNSKEIDLSDLSKSGLFLVLDLVFLMESWLGYVLGKISDSAWVQFANSKYVVNVKTLYLSNGTLLNHPTESEEDMRRYFLSSETGTKCQSLF